MNGMVHGESLTLVPEWNGPWQKNENTTKNYFPVLVEDVSA